MTSSKIEWTDETWNPLVGCSIMSPGCKNCYAMEMAWRLKAMGKARYQYATMKPEAKRGDKPRAQKAVWTGDIIQDRSVLSKPRSWKKPRMIFVNSMSDLFHPGVDEDFIRDVWQVMEETPRHTYQILTKRPDRMRKILSQWKAPPLPNVWLGTSVEDSRVMERITDLRFTPAAVRFVSFEPLIGSVANTGVSLMGMDWVIVGGESGNRARPMNEAWVHEIKGMCEAHDPFIPLFFKQWGTWGQDGVKRSKRANGRLFKGKLWDDMPRQYNAQTRTTAAKVAKQKGQ